jgi:hypothetical protein
MSRIRECRREGFPQCLEVSLFRIFRQCSEDASVERIAHSLHTVEKGKTPVRACSASQVWMIYDQVLRDIARELGADVAQVAEFQSLKEMESMNCMLCPLYRREMMRIRGR